MKFGAQWSVKGIRPEARESAQKAARRSGMSLGDWLNSVILNSTDGDEDQYDEHGGQDVAALHGRLDELNRRIEQLTRRGRRRICATRHPLIRRHHRSRRLRRQRWRLHR